MKKEIKKIKDRLDHLPVALRATYDLILKVNDKIHTFGDIEMNHEDQILVVNLDCGSFSISSDNVRLHVYQIIQIHDPDPQEMMDHMGSFNTPEQVVEFLHTTEATMTIRHILMDIRNPEE